MDVFFFFFQAEDGIRDHCVTGVQTCALPIFNDAVALEKAFRDNSQALFQSIETKHLPDKGQQPTRANIQIGRASCRERWRYRGAPGDEKKKERKQRWIHTEPSVE